MGISVCVYQYCFQFIFSDEDCCKRKSGYCCSKHSHSCLVYLVVKRPVIHIEKAILRFIGIIFFKSSTTLSLCEFHLAKHFWILYVFFRGPAWVESSFFFTRDAGASVEWVESLALISTWGIADLVGEETLASEFIEVGISVVFKARIFLCAHGPVLRVERQFICRLLANRPAHSVDRFLDVVLCGPPREKGVEIIWFQAAALGSRIYEIFAPNCARFSWFLRPAFARQLIEVGCWRTHRRGVALRPVARVLRLKYS